MKTWKEELPWGIKKEERGQERTNSQSNNICLKFRGIPEFKEETTQTLKDIINNSELPAQHNRQRI